MIPPLSDEEYDLLVPAWAKRLHELHIPHVVGLPVCNILYWNKYADDVHGWIVTAAEFGSMPCRCCRDIKQEFVTTERDGSVHGGLGSYYVADVTTEIGREHVRAWCLANDVDLEEVL